MASIRKKCRNVALSLLAPSWAWGTRRPIRGLTVSQSEARRMRSGGERIVTSHGPSLQWHQATHGDPGVLISCDWSRQVTWPEYWPVIGPGVTRGNNQSGINWDQSDRNWAQVMPSLLTWKHKSHVTLTTHWARLSLDGRQGIQCTLKIIWGYAVTHWKLFGGHPVILSHMEF